MKNIISANICTSFELSERVNIYLAKICQPKMLKRDIDIAFEIDFKSFLINILGREISQ